MHICGGGVLHPYVVNSTHIGELYLCGMYCIQKGRTAHMRTDLHLNEVNCISPGWTSRMRDDLHLSGVSFSFAGRGKQHPWQMDFTHEYWILLKGIVKQKLSRWIKSSNNLYVLPQVLTIGYSSENLKGCLLSVRLSFCQWLKTKKWHILIHGMPAVKNWKQRGHHSYLGQLWLRVFTHFPLETNSVICNKKRPYAIDW